MTKQQESAQLDLAQVIQTLAHSLTLSLDECVFGQQQAKRFLIGAFLIGGHVLLEGPPGIAKTLLAKTFAAALGLSFQRIQFTPDLMPSDITGVNVFEPKSATFHFVPGPLFADIILADEINRTPPKTQAALLEAMEEGQLTIDGTRRELSSNFLVIATQNPFEYEGTFPLPEAQLDRFLFRIRLSYTDKDFEQQMIIRESSLLTKNSALFIGPIAPAVSNLAQARTCLRQIVLTPVLAEYIYRIINSTRSHPEILLGGSPRAALHLALAAKYLAALDGRYYAIPDDVKAATIMVLNHRLILRPEAFEEERNVDDILRDLLAHITVPAEAAPLTAPVG